LWVGGMLGFLHNIKTPRTDDRRIDITSLQNDIATSFPFSRTESR
jgi:hypothetical protein